MSHNVQFIPVKPNQFEQLFEQICLMTSFYGKGVSIPHYNKFKLYDSLLNAGKVGFHAEFIYTKSEGVCGYITYNIAFTSSACGFNLYVDDIYLNSGVQRKGIGKLIIEHLQRKAKGIGSSKLMWQVAKTNERAIDFYIKQGAEITDDHLSCELAV
ncbi:GNAT family N-acetyltransferase [Aliivibrio fischeri]|uniref:GNAT family N-acetyltransferase n=1 Tax=Aliivibrio fischeri TaxID=668 RepID=UPI00373621D2